MGFLVEAFVKYWLQFFCGAIAALMTLLWRRIIKNRKESETKENAMEQALLALLRDRLYQACRYHLKNGYITTGDLEVLNGLNECYKAMGGNSTVHRMMQRIQNLELRVDEPH